MVVQPFAERKTIARLAGRRPIELLQMVVQHLEKEAEPLERYRPEIPPALASIVRRLMAKKPEKRFQTPPAVERRVPLPRGPEPPKDAGAARARGIAVEPHHRAV